MLGTAVLGTFESVDGRPCTDDGVRYVCDLIPPKLFSSFRPSPFLPLVILLLAGTPPIC